MRVNILLLNLFNVQARQVLMESRLPNSVLSKVILNLMSSLFTLHYIAYTRFFMQTIFNGVAYECRRLRFGLLLTVTATECLTRRSSVSPCEIILRLVLFVQIPKKNARYLIEYKLAGNDLPCILPPHLKPPSHRWSIWKR